jgi:hypothetical protein
LLFIFALWHGNAKYRTHTDITVAQFKRVTFKLGQSLRQFKNHVCPAFETQETPREAEARQRRELRRKAKHPTYFASHGIRKTTVKKSFNLATPKMHALGDYADEVPKRGTSDNYTTQNVSDFSYGLCIILWFLEGECEHQIPKRLFRSTNKKNYEAQIGKHVEQKEQMNRINDRVSHQSGHGKKYKKIKESLPLSDPNAPYHIGEGVRFSKDIPVWLGQHQDDPAIQVSFSC